MRKSKRVGNGTTKKSTIENCANTENKQQAIPSMARLYTLAKSKQVILYRPLHLQERKPTSRSFPAEKACQCFNGANTVIAIPRSQYVANKFLDRKKVMRITPNNQGSQSSDKTDAAVISNHVKHDKKFGQVGSLRPEQYYKHKEANAEEVVELPARWELLLAH